jgi:hypothetical protein
MGEVGVRRVVSWEGRSGRDEGVLLF